MTNLLTRRLALFRIATAGTVAAVAGVPVALAAVQPKSPESADLIRLGDDLIAAAKVLALRSAELAAARATCDSLWPAVPRSLYVNHPYGPWCDSRQERDCAHMALARVHPGAEYAWPREYYHADAIRAVLETLPKQGGTPSQKLDCKRATTLLPLAVAYEAECAAALATTDYEAKVNAQSNAEFQVDQLLRSVSGTPSRSPLGITIKAQCYQACVAIGKEGSFQAAIHLGPSIADDVCRVLSEGDEA